MTLSSQSFVSRALALFVLCILLTTCTTFTIADKYTSARLKKKQCILNTILVDDVSVEYWDNGNEKPVLVLIHGFGATPEFQWYKQIKALEKDYRLIIPSLLYFGETQPVGSHKYEIQDQVALITGLLDSLQIKTAHICGVSYGGLVAGELTRQHPERVRKLVLFDAVLKYYSHVEIKQLCKAYEISDFKELFVPADEKDLRRLLKVAYKTPPPVPAFLLKSVQKEIYQENREHLKLLLEAMHSKMNFFQAQDYKFNNKTLLIWGEQDDVVSVKTAKKLNKHLINSKLVVIPKTKHMPNLEKPRLFNSIITEFLKED